MVTPAPRTVDGAHGRAVWAGVQIELVTVGWMTIEAVVGLPRGSSPAASY
jgi:hypothetical protein